MVAKLLQFPSGASPQTPPDRYRSPMNVHGTLDDYGLNPYEFRVLGHIARRGQCWEGRELMGRACGMSSGKAWEAVQVLVKVGILRETKRGGGHANVYEMEPDQSQWADPSQLEGARLEAAGRRGNTRTAKTKKPPLPVHTMYTTCTCGEDTCTCGEGDCTSHVHKVNPSKLIQEVNPINQERSGSQANAAPAPQAEQYGDSHIEQPPAPVQTPEEPKAQAEGGKSSAAPAKKSKPKKKQRKVSAPKLQPEAFEGWWKTYREFCVRVSEGFGVRAEAVAIWDELMEEGVDPAEIQEATEWYVKCKEHQYSVKGEAIGVAHGMRYLRDDKWQEALLHKRHHTAKQQADPNTPPPLPQVDWATDPRAEDWITDLKRRGPFAFCELREGGFDRDRKSFVKWAIDAGHFSTDAVGLEKFLNG